MVQTISWMVTRRDLGSRPRASGLIQRWFLVGGLVGGATGGLVVAGVARLTYVVVGEQTGLFLLASAAVAFLYGMHTIGVWSMPKPQVAQQVPSAWRDVLPVRAASFLYALTLGFTFATRVSSLALYPLLVLSLGLGKWPLAVIALFAIAGLTRAATALIVPLRGWDGASNSVMVPVLEAGAQFTIRLEAVVLLLGAAAMAGAGVA